jgi:hypothetical protein
MTNHAKEPNPWDAAKSVPVIRGHYDLEAGVKFFVLMLEKLGAVTEFSCEGHPHGFYITFEAPYELAWRLERWTVKQSSNPRRTKRKFSGQPQPLGKKASANSCFEIITANDGPPPREFVKPADYPRRNQVPVAPGAVPGPARPTLRPASR